MTSTTRPCAGCRQHVTPAVSLEPAPPPHFAVLRCPECGQHMGFAKKPETDDSAKRREAKHRKLVARHGADQCEMCLRTADELSVARVALEAHHVREYADGGDCDRSNLRFVCTPCHRLIHWTRTYHGGRGE